MKIKDYYRLAFDPNELSPDTHYFKGICWANGYFVTKDITKAKEAYIEGIAHSSAKCKYGLAIVLIRENFSKEAICDLFKEAFESLNKEALNGDEISQRMISCYYLFGDRGVKKDLEKAKYWLELSANNSDVDAQLDLANCYAEGFCFEKDIEKAIFWYKKALTQGNLKAKTYLDKLEELKNE